jgi:hypothetical protein
MEATLRKVTLGAVLALAGALAPAPAAGAAGATDATCYSEATFRLAEGLTDEPNDTSFHTVEDGTVQCFGTIDGRVVSGEVGTISATGRSSSTSCTSGTGEFLARVKIPRAGGDVAFTMRVEFTRIALTGTASGYFVNDRTPVTAGFAAQPLDGDCRNDPVDHVTIRVAADIG